jgi:hypothetical protein
MTQTFRGGAVGPAFCVDCRRPIPRGVRCKDCLSPTVRGGNRTSVRLMSLARVGRGYVVFRAATLAGVWHWLTVVRQQGRPRSRYYVDQASAPALRPRRGERHA